MKIGRVEIPAITKIEKKPLKGGVYEISIDGVCFKNSTFKDELDVQIENIHSLKSDDLSEPKLIHAVGVKSPIIVDSKAGYNFIDYAGLRGFIAVKEINENKDAERLNIREVSISGFYMPDTIYKRALKLSITDLQNDWGITGRTLVALPPNSKNIGGATELYTIDSEDGQIGIYEASGDEVAFDCELSDEELGAVTVWDTNSTTAPTETDLANKSTGGVAWSKVLNKEHDFGDNWIVIENGLIAIAIKDNTPEAKVFYYNTGWKELGVLTLRFPNWGFIDRVRITYISPDIVKMKVFFTGDAVNNPDEYETTIISIFRGKSIINIETIDRNPDNDYSVCLTVYGDFFVSDTYVKDRTLFPSIYTDGTNQYAIQFKKNSDFIALIYNTKQRLLNVSFGLRVGIPNMKYYGFAIIPFDTTKLFAEAENGTISGDTTNVFVDSDVDASNGQAVKFQPVTANSYIVIANMTGLPAGKYRIFYRIKVDDNTDTNYVVRIYTVNVDTGEYPNSTILTGTDFTSANTYEYKYFDIDYDGVSNISIRASRATTYSSTTSAWIDYVLIVPITNGKNFPQDIAHDAMRLVEPRRVLKVR